MATTEYDLTEVPVLFAVKIVTIAARVPVKNVQVGMGKKLRIFVVYAECTCVATAGRHSMSVSCQTCHPALRKKAGLAGHRKLRSEAHVFNSPARAKVAKLITPSGSKQSSSKGVGKKRKIGQKLAARAENKHDKLLTESPAVSSIETPQKSITEKIHKAVRSRNILAVWRPWETPATSVMAAATRSKKRQRAEENSKKQNDKLGQISVKVILNREVVGENLVAEADC